MTFVNDSSNANLASFHRPVFESLDEVKKQN